MDKGVIKEAANDEYDFPDIDVDGNVFLVVPEPYQCLSDGSCNQMGIAGRVASALQNAGIRTDLLTVRDGDIHTVSMVTHYGTGDQRAVLKVPKDDSLTSSGRFSESSNFISKQFKVGDNSGSRQDLMQDLMATLDKMMDVKAYTLVLVLAIHECLNRKEIIEQIANSNTKRMVSILTYVQGYIDVATNSDAGSKGDAISLPNGTIISHFKGNAMTVYESRVKPPDIDIASYDETMFTSFAYGLAIGLPFSKLSKAIMHNYKPITKHAVVTLNPAMLVKECGRVIYSREGAKQLKRLLQGTRTTLALTTGCFDIFHAGHAASLDDAKSQADVLVVALNSDTSVRQLKGDKRPICLLRHRLRVLLALTAVDFVVVFEEAKPNWVVDILDPDVFAKGSDYTIDRLRKSFPQFQHEVHVSKHEYDVHTSCIIDKCKL